MVVAIVGIGAVLGSFAATTFLDTGADDAAPTPTATAQRTPAALLAPVTTPTHAPTPSPTPEPTPQPPPTPNVAMVAYSELAAQFAFAKMTIPIGYEDFDLLVGVYGDEGAMRYVATGGWDPAAKVCEPWEWYRDWPW